jgi:hypothetical protein
MPRVQGLFPLQYVVQQTRLPLPRHQFLFRQLIRNVLCLGGRSPFHLALNNFRWSNGVRNSFMLVQMPCMNLIQSQTCAALYLASCNPTTGMSDVNTVLSTAGLLCCN